MIIWLSVLTFLIIDALLLLRIALLHKARNGSDFPQYRQIDHRARTNAIATEQLNCQQNDHIIGIAYARRSMPPGVPHHLLNVLLDVRHECTAPRTAARQRINDSPANFGNSPSVRPTTQEMACVRGGKWPV